MVKRDEIVGTCFVDNKFVERIYLYIIFGEDLRKENMDESLLIVADDESMHYHQILNLVYLTLFILGFFGRSNVRGGRRKGPPCIEFYR